MGQTRLERTHFEPRVEVLNPKNDDKQDVDFTGYFEIGDVVDVIDVDAAGNIISVLADNLSIIAINDSTKFVVLSAAADTTAATGIPKIRVQEIDDGFTAIDRLYRRRFRGTIGFNLVQGILAQALNSPIAGQTTLDIADASFWKTGDLVDILADEGVIGSDITIVSVNPNADAANNRSTIVVSGVYDTSTFTNPFILNKTISLEDAIKRNQERIDGIDTPVENQDLGIGNALDTSFIAPQLFIEGSSKLFIDGKRAKKGIAGTRASFLTGTGNAQLTVTSLLLGKLGNKVNITVQAGAGLTVSVSKFYKANSYQIVSAQTAYTIIVNDNGGAATSKDIADAINLDPDAKKIIQVQFGGDGSGTITPFSSNLSGGLDDGNGDYAELEQIFENKISGTGFKILSLHMRPNERNRFSSPPEDDEELYVDFRKATENVNR